MSGLETALEWPSFCYTNSLFNDNNKPPKTAPVTKQGRKKATPSRTTYNNNKRQQQQQLLPQQQQQQQSDKIVLSDNESSASVEDEQLVPQGPGSTSPARPQPDVNEEFAFSALMRKMAQKYQDSADKEESTPSRSVAPFQPISLPTVPLPNVSGSAFPVNPLVLQAAFRSYFPFQLPMQPNPLFPPMESLVGSQALSALARKRTFSGVAETENHMISEQKRRKTDGPLDLSLNQSIESEDDVIDVLSVDIPTSNFDVDRWSVDQVATFISKVDSCSDYAEVFRDQGIDGSALLELTEQHLTGILGLKLGPAIRLKNAIRELAKSSNCGSRSPSVSSPSSNSVYSL